MSAPSDLVAKRRKMDGTAKPSSSSAATATASASAAAGDRANVIAQLEDADGNPAGPQLDLPHDADHTQLETLLNALLQNEDKVPFAFYAADAEVIGPLGAHLAKRGASTETVLKIVYQPQALFRVRPVTRCSSAIPGHAEAVLSVAFSPDGKNLASGSGDTTIRLWNHDTETPKATLKGAFYLTLVPIRPRSRGERRSLRTLPGVSLRPPLGFNPRPRCLSTPLLTPFNSTHRSFQLGSLHRVVAGRAAARVRVDGQGRAAVVSRDGRGARRADARASEARHRARVGARARAVSAREIGVGVRRRHREGLVGFFFALPSLSYYKTLFPVPTSYIARVMT
jgi:hypothetical protein